MATAFVFPGQGRQTVCMGRALAEADPAARAVFEEVDEALGQKLSELFWDGPGEALTLTANTRPALDCGQTCRARVPEAEGFASPVPQSWSPAIC